MSFENKEIKHIDFGSICRTSSYHCIYGWNHNVFTHEWSTNRMAHFDIYIVSRDGETP